MFHDVGEERVGHARGGAAPGIAGKITIQVAAVRQITHAAIKALNVDDGNGDDRAVEFFDVDVIEHTARYFYAVQLIAMHGGGETQDRARYRAVEHEHRHRRDEAFHRLTAGPREFLACTLSNFAADQAQAALRLQLRRRL